jgi:preprotein translocase subunit SecY
MARFCGFDFSVRQRKKYSVLLVPAEDLLSAFRSGSWSKVPALRQRVLFTLGVVLVYRLGTYIPIPGVNADFMRQLLDEHRHDALGFFDVFTGGAVRRFSLFTLNIAPYLTAAGLIKRATPLVPRLKELKDQGLAGYAILDRYAMCLAALIALFVAFQVSGALEGASNAAGPAVAHSGWRFRLTCMVILVGGTLLLTWLGRLINQRGIGPGFILVGTSGLFVNLPVAIESLSGFGRSAGWPPYAVWLLLPSPNLGSRLKVPGHLVVPPLSELVRCRGQPA